MLNLESKVNFVFLLLHHFLVVFSCFDFSYSLSSAQVSLDYTKLGLQINQWKARLQELETRMTKNIFKYELSFKKLRK